MFEKKKKKKKNSYSKLCTAFHHLSLSPLSPLSLVINAAEQLHVCFVFHFFFFLFLFFSFHFHDGGTPPRLGPRGRRPPLAPRRRYTIPQQSYCKKQIHERNTYHCCSDSSSSISTCSSSTPSSSSWNSSSSTWCAASHHTSSSSSSSIASPSSRSCSGSRCRRCGSSSRLIVHMNSIGLFRLNLIRGKRRLITG